MIFSKEIASLKNLLGEAEGKLTAALGNVASLERDKAGLEARVKDLEAAALGGISAAEHEAALKLKTDEIATLTEKLGAARQSVETKVVEGIASAGVPAVRRDPAAVDKDAKPSAGSGESPQRRLASLTKIAGQ